MTLLFLHGLPGVGKLTVARELERITGAPIFHNHLTVDLLLSVFEFGSPGFVELREMIWLGVFERAAAGLPGLIFTFAAERTVEDGFAERAVGAVESAGGEVVFVELTCEIDALRRRIESPDRRKFGKLASAELFDRLVAEGTLFRLEPPAGSRRISIDTTRLDPAEAAARIAREMLG